MTETVKRIIELMELRGDNAHSLEIKTDLPISSIVNWKKERFQPSVDSIKSLSRYFNVSADYLLCLTDEPKPLKTANIAKVNISALAELSQDWRFIDSAKLYKAMTNEYKQQIYTYILSVAMGVGLNVQQILRK